jgi:hypothetical protein
MLGFARDSRVIEHTYAGNRSQSRVHILTERIQYDVKMQDFLHSPCFILNISLDVGMQYLWHKLKVFLHMYIGVLRNVHTVEKLQFQLQLQPLSRNNALHKRSTH